MNISPVLMCGRCDGPTLHVFMDRRAQERTSGEVAYVDLVYECDSCGAVRAWGSEPRPVKAAGHNLMDTAFAHAVEQHGMEQRPCQGCHGFNLNCPECDGEGVVWEFDSLDPCGLECPLSRFATQVTG